jgi:hypothetical protein
MSDVVKVTPDHPLVVTANNRTFDVVDLEGGQITIKTDDETTIATLNQAESQSQGLGSVLRSSLGGAMSDQAEGRAS